MTTAPSIAFAFASAASADPGDFVVRAELGFAGALPTLLAGGEVGVAPGVDLGAHAVTHAGLAVATGATVRYLPATLGGGLTVDHSFYTVDDLGGIESLRAPFGNRTAAVPALLGRRTSPEGLVLDWAAAAEIGVLRLEDTVGGPARTVRPALDHLHGEITAHWPRREGTFFVRFRATVPVAADFHVLGYLPWVGVGRTWGLR